jgi:hypothetical protein
MNLIEEYTADSSKFLREWRKRGSAPARFLADVRKHVSYDGICWRGTSLRSLSSKSPVLSASKSLEVGFDFASYHTQAAIVAFVGHEAYDISPSSVHPDEDEVLVVLDNGYYDSVFITWLEGVQVFMSFNESLPNTQFPLWEQEVRYKISRFQSFMIDYDL